ncbi:bile acid:sodium symporter family protein [Alcanivorax sp. 1008]|uniref:bile acid:sodium symporter family protein n=1 Tax=Alcanivorax sp. 1008 TaxID=2816853 RepID=UPI001D9362F8|nr:bile acid:sodium symporter [Alcanivorax sp. 1008]MCC1497869.1 bile acid:sodium symporter family protein [Alcanivorax sp. 1008]
MQGGLVDIGLPAALFLIMIGMGLTLTPKDFREVLIAPKATFFGLLAQVLIVPLAAFGLAWVMQLDPLLAVGLVIIAACPGGTTSNIFTYLGGGDVALSVVLTVLASLAAIVTLPLFAGLALDLFQDASVAIQLPVGRTIVSLIVIVIVPLIIGMTLRKWAPVFAARAERFVGAFGMTVLVLVIVAILLSLGDRVVTLARDGTYIAVALNIIGIAIGLGGGRLIGLDLKQSFTIAVELGLKNATLGLMITLTLLHSNEMSVPSAVYGVVMFFLGGLLVMFSRKMGLVRPAIADS